ncbi:unnamed protein product, partial [Phaeothamnion confervicola]
MASLRLDPALAALVRNSRGDTRAALVDRGSLFFLKRGDDGTGGDGEAAAAAAAAGTGPTPSIAAESTAAAIAAARTPVAEPPLDSWEDIADDGAAVAPPNLPSEAPVVVQPSSGPDAEAVWLPDLPPQDAEPTPQDAASADAVAAAAAAAEQEAAEASAAAEAGVEAENARLRLLPAPVILVDIASICGFRRDAPEAVLASAAAELRQKLGEDFDGRTQELFDIGMARHSIAAAPAAAAADASPSDGAPGFSGAAASSDLPGVGTDSLRRDAAGAALAVVAYPERVGGRSTERQWRKVCEPSPHAAAVTLAKRCVRDCNRPLPWKAAAAASLEYAAAWCTREAAAVRERARASSGADD